MLPRKLLYPGRAGTTEPSGPRKRLARPKSSSSQVAASSGGAAPAAGAGAATKLLGLMSRCTQPASCSSWMAPSACRPACRCIISINGSSGGGQLRRPCSSWFVFSVSYTCHLSAHLNGEWVGAAEETMQLVGMHGSRTPEMSRKLRRIVVLELAAGVCCARLG